MTEEQFQAMILDLAGKLGWETYHPYLSIFSAKGWPDLAMWRERLILAEIKTQRGKVSESQQSVIAGLRTAKVEVYVWRPSDYEEIVKVLMRREESHG